MHADWLNIVFLYLNRNTEPARAAHIIALAKRIYILIIKVNKLFSWQNQKNRKMHFAEESKKQPSLLTKTKNQRLNWRNPANHARHQNRKTAVFKCENRKTEPKVGQIRKIENPNAPLLKVIENLYCVSIKF